MTNNMKRICLLFLLFSTGWSVFAQTGSVEMPLLVSGYANTGGISASVGQIFDAMAPDDASISIISEGIQQGGQSACGDITEVEDVDHKRREVYCSPVKGNIPAYFGDVAGDIHTRILERMYRVLSEDLSYPYLMPHAVCRLADARDTFRKSLMSERPLVHLGGKMWALFPWLGSYAFLALERFLKLRCARRLGLKGLNSSRPYYMQFTLQVSEAEFYEIVCEEAERDLDPLELVYPKENPVFEKYDEFVPEELVRKGFALGVLDTEGMKSRVLGWRRFLDGPEE